MMLQLKYSYLTFRSMGDVAATLRTRSTNSSLTSARCNGFRASSYSESIASTHWLLNRLLTGTSKLRVRQPKGQIRYLEREARHFMQ